MLGYSGTRLAGDLDTRGLGYKELEYKGTWVKAYSEGTRVLGYKGTVVLGFKGTSILGYKGIQDCKLKRIF